MGCMPCCRPGPPPGRGPGMGGPGMGGPGMGGPGYGRGPGMGGPGYGRGPGMGYAPRYWWINNNYIICSNNPKLE